MSFLTRRRKGRLAAREKTASRKQQEIEEREDHMKHMAEQHGIETNVENDKEEQRQRGNGKKSSGSGFPFFFGKRKNH
jgi:hypothetical protein